MEDKYLYKGSYFDIENFKGWEIIRERRGDIMQVFPLMITNNGMKLGIRNEWCPAYFIREKTQDKKYYTIVSGGIDEGENPIDTCYREIREETGLVNPKDIGKLYSIKNFLPLTKSTSLRTYLFAFTFKEDEAIWEKPEGDGSITEEKSFTVWVTLEELEKIIKEEDCDMLTFLAYYFFKSTMLELENKK